MAKRPMLEFILNLINFILMICSFGILGYGLVCFFNLKQNPSNTSQESNVKYLVADRILLSIQSSNSSFDLLPKPLFIYLVIGLSAILFIISCVGFIGTSLRSPSCLIFYFVLSLALVLTEVGVTIFISVKHKWKEGIPIDRSTVLQMVYHFLYGNWSIIKWIVLAIFILQVIGVIEAVYLVVVFKSSSYDESENDESLQNTKRGWTNYMQSMQTSRSPPPPTPT